MSPRRLQQARILDALDEGPRTVSALALGLGYSALTVRRAVSGLLAAGEVARVGRLPAARGMGSSVLLRRVRRAATP